MAEDKLCNILYCMVKHNWHSAFRKSSRTASSMTVMALEGYFEKIILHHNLKQKGLETIVVDDDSYGKKSPNKKKGKAEPSTKKGGKQNTYKKSHFSGQPKYESFMCVLCKQFGGAEETHNTKD
eukprot:6043691-Ditylum_brightwellii.AAC.1